MPTDTQPEPDHVTVALELEAATRRILARLGIAPTWLPVVAGTKGPDGWEHDLHTLVLPRLREHRKPLLVFEYRTGLGHRVPRPLGVMIAPGKASKPPKVTPGQVLGSVARECRGPYLDRETFTDWASEYGYDTDSRKAEGIYNACREGGEKLAAVGLTVGEIAELADLAGRL